MEKTLEKAEIAVEVIPMLTLFGKKDFIKLPDSAYGEWLVFKGHELTYYINLWDPYFSELKTIIDDKKTTIEGFIDFVNKKYSQTFTLNQNFLGLKKWSEVEYAKVEVYKFPF